MKSFRQDDMHAEQQLSIFLDKYFYPTLPFKSSRVSDKYLQMAGVDVAIEKDGSTKYVDEKAAFYYANKVLNTWAFELSFINRGGNHQIGWFVNDDLKTDIYNLMYLKTTGKPVGQLDISDFTEVEIYLVSKKAAREYVYRYISEEELADLEVFMRNPDNNAYRHVVNEYITVVLSHKLKEKPFNVLINKAALKEIAILNCEVRHE